MKKQFGFGVCMVVTGIIIILLTNEFYKDYKGVTNENTAQSMQED